MTPSRHAHPATRSPRGALGATALTAALASLGCARPPLATVEELDLDQFMGRWYVLASIPTFLERGAHNAVETYRRAADGTIETTFTFRRDAFDGKLVEYQPRGYVSEQSPAVWGMQFVWPIKAEYRIVYLDPDYSLTVIGRSARDYVWLMARTPEITDEEYEHFLGLVRELDYDATRVRRVPHRW
jgi:apolipoprotein D and lipocalin family protein